VTFEKKSTPLFFKFTLG